MYLYTLAVDTRHMSTDKYIHLSSPIELYGSGARAAWHRPHPLATHTSQLLLFFPLPLYVYMIIYANVNRPREAATCKVNKQITERNHKKNSSFPLLCSHARQTVCVGGNYTYRKCCRFIILLKLLLCHILGMEN